MFFFKFGDMSEFIVPCSTEVVPELVPDMHPKKSKCQLNRIPGVAERLEACEAGVELEAAVEAVDERAEARVPLLQHRPPRRQIASPANEMAILRSHAL